MSNIHKGKIKQWNQKKGFGFILPENGKKEIFIHISALKNTNHPPVAGDIISYQIHTDNNGKNRAVNASIEGIPTIKKRSNRKTVNRHTYKSTHSSNPFYKLLFLGLLIFAGFFFYNNFFKKSNHLVIDKSPIIFVPTVPTLKQVKHNFKCDGRQHCSQMNSKAEAIFFIRNCPNTKMDGDHDGNPCENDSRF